MRLDQINAIRAQLGLDPHTVDATKAAKAKRRLANLAAKAQANRDLKAKRNSNRKG